MCWIVFAGCISAMVVPGIQIAEPGAPAAVSRSYFGRPTFARNSNIAKHTSRIVKNAALPSDISTYDRTLFDPKKPNPIDERRDGVIPKNPLPELSEDDRARISDAGSTRERFQLAMYYLHPHTTDPYPIEAMRILQGLADKDFSPAYLPLANLYRTAPRRERSFARSAEYAYKSYEQLGRKDALQLLKTLAEENNPTAQSRLGDIYLFLSAEHIPSLTILERLEEAKHWYTMAANNNRVEAKYQLAYIYGQLSGKIWNGFNFDGVFEAEKLSHKYLDDVKAAKYDIKQDALKQGQIERMQSFQRLHLPKLAPRPELTEQSIAHIIEKDADVEIYHLAGKLISGVGAKRDVPKAVLLLRKLVDRKYAPAMVELAQLHEVGKGVVMNSGKALELYLMAVETGNPISGLFEIERMAHSRNAKAMGIMGDIYQFGLGVKPNEDLALQWYENGAKGGDAASQYQASLYYTRQANFLNELGQSEKAHSLLITAKRFMHKALQKGFNPNTARKPPNDNA